MTKINSNRKLIHPISLENYCLMSVACKARELEAQQLLDALKTVYGYDMHYAAAIHNRMRRLEADGLFQSRIVEVKGWGCKVRRRYSITEKGRKIHENMKQFLQFVSN